MNIAIDLTATPKNKSGVGRYLYNLVQKLQELDQRNIYYLFIQDDDIEGFNIFNSNFKVIGVASKILRNVWIRLLWEQIVLPSKLKQLKIDILHSPHYTMPYGSHLVNIVTIHDMTFFVMPQMHSFIKRLLFKAYIRLTVKRARALITISKETLKDMNRILGVNSNKVSVTHMGVDERFFERSNSNKELLKLYGIEGEYFLYVGTIEPRKNIIRILEAYNKLDEIIKQKYKLVIAGKKGWMYEEIFQYIKNNSLEKNIHFTGFVKDEHLPNLFQQAKLFIYVSLYEGFGIPVIEAMASGIPTITSNCSSMKEVSAGTCLEVNPYKVSEIKDAIMTVLNDEALCADLIKRGLERAKEFSWEKCAEKTLNAYEEAVKAT